MPNFRIYLLLISILTILVLIVNTYYANLDILADNNFNVGNNMIIYANDKILFLSGTNYTDKKIWIYHHLVYLYGLIQLWMFKNDQTIKRFFNFLINNGGMNSETKIQYELWNLVNPRRKIQGRFDTKDGDDYYITSKERYNDWKWLNVITTYGTKTIRLYTDDKEFGNKSIAFHGIEPDTVGKQPLRVDANSLTLNNKINGNFTGYVGNIIMCGKALNAQEISTINDKQLFLKTDNQLNTQINKKNNDCNALENMGHILMDYLNDENDIINYLLFIFWEYII